MSIKYAKVYKRTPQQEARFSVLLDDYYCPGNCHADIVLSVHETGDKLIVNFRISGQDFAVVDSFDKVYTAEDLNISATERK